MSFVPDEVKSLLYPVRVRLQVLVLRGPLVHIQEDLLEILDRGFSILQEDRVVDWGLALEVLQLRVHIQFAFVLRGPFHVQGPIERLPTLPRVIEENGRFINTIR